MTISSEVYEVRPPVDDVVLETLGLYGLALVIWHGSRVYIVQELKSEKPQINVVTETCKHDVKIILDSVLLKSHPSKKELNRLLQLLQAEVARAVAEEYGNIGESESLEVVVHVTPSIVKDHADSKYANKPVLLILANARLITVENAAPAIHSPSHAHEVKSLGFQTIPIQVDQLGVADHATDLPVTFKPVGIKALELVINSSLGHLHEHVRGRSGVTIIDGVTFYSFRLSPSQIKRARRRSKLTDCRNVNEAN